MPNQTKQDNKESRRDFLKTSSKILLGATTLSSLGTHLFSTEIEERNYSLNLSKGENMNTLTPQAKENLQKLFGTSALPKEDLEFFTNYANFAFDEVWQKSNLKENERLLLILASLVALSAKEEFEIMLKATLKSKINPIAIKEIIYQATPYVGIAKVADALVITNKIFKQQGVKLPLESQSTTNQQNRREKGFEIQKNIFGTAIEKSYDSTPAHKKHINEFLSANCFGDYYTRKGLDLAFRELITFVYLISMGGVEPQVKAHIQGNLNMGNDKTKLIAVVTALVPYIGYPKSLNALNVIDEIAK